uniref:Kinesin-like protein n=1 Tax=Odontella aurita TaxID=265563 RepID=A0A7S4JQC1_9STRA|mmetsp:Transcript_51718/g.155223  ORF Transcript_51718/g.155223 Transcript_51718/m.155223 type:complete len:541 (+) Transcript_51718:325-1947(+)
MGGNRRASSGMVAPAKDQTRRRIERMEAEREERRRAMQDRRAERAAEEERNLKAGNPGDVDFIGLVRRWREEHGGSARPHGDSSSLGEHPKICICVRKRPVSDKERKKRDHDSVTCLHPTTTVHSAKLRVDGISKYLDNSSFRFDHSFDEASTTEDVYLHSTRPLVDFVCSGKGGRATVFAYGQTGSGKTFTMGGIQSMVAADLFDILHHGGGVSNSCTLEDTAVTVTFFEIYGGRIQDLLNERKRLKLLEDGKGEVVVAGLEEFGATTPDEFFSLVDVGNGKRTTHATEANDTSSRSHAICQILLRDKGTSRLRGKLSLVDLAGSERGTDTKSHNRQRRTESSEINTSLLALKECIRALDSGRGSARHVPYRASKLTLILKDCFTSKLARTTMIATVSPGASSADHTVNTLRYADRIKEKKVRDMSVTDQPVVKAPKRRSPTRNPRMQESSSSISPPGSIVRKSHRSIAEVEQEESLDDLEILHASLKDDNSEEESSDNGAAVAQLHRTVQALFEEEEDLLNLHMSIIQVSVFTCVTIL